VICLQTLSSLASTIKVLSQEPGKDFEIVTVSFDPRETPALAFRKKTEFVERTGKPQIAAGWHFLTGTKESIDRLTRAAGFRYVWDEPSQQFAHPTGIIILGSAGRIARYLFGIDYGPRDLRLAILDASAGKVGSPIERVLLYCYHYDLTTGRYSLAIMRGVQVAGAATVLSIGTLIFVMSRRPTSRRSARRTEPRSVRGL
jgi:protein SCO1/2